MKGNIFKHGLSKKSQTKARNLYQGLKNERIPEKFKKRIQDVKKLEQNVYQEHRQIRQMKRNPEKISERKNKIQEMENLFEKKVYDLDRLFDDYIIGKPESGKFYPEGSPKKTKPKKPTPKKTGGKIMKKNMGGPVRQRVGMASKMTNRKAGGPVRQRVGMASKMTSRKASGPVRQRYSMATGKK